MTTAAKKKKKKKVMAKKKTAPAAKKKKKPKWVKTSFTKIEKIRKSLGMTKSAMAVALEITNSTYHNWRRGDAVPHPAQQEIILMRLQTLQGITTTPASNGGAAPASKRRTLTQTRGTQSDASGDTGRGEHWTKALQKQGKAQARAASVSPGPSTGVPRGPEVAAIDGASAVAVAFINAQAKAPSAGSVLTLIKDIRTVLS